MHPMSTLTVTATLIKTLQVDVSISIQAVETRGVTIYRVTYVAIQ